MGPTERTIHAQRSIVQPRTGFPAGRLLYFADTESSIKLHFVNVKRCIWDDLVAELWPMGAAAASVALAQAVGCGARLQRNN